MSTEEEGSAPAATEEGTKDAPAGPPKKCETPGCNFLATWHPTHCCTACKEFEGKGHGEKCQGKLAEITSDKPLELPMRRCQSAGCPFQATWDVWYCCTACQKQGPKGHGDSCGQKPFHVGKGKGKGKFLGAEGKGKGKGGGYTAYAGKGKGKGKAAAAGEVRMCKTPGCTFQATWNPEYCCGGCKDGGKDTHGPRCEKKPAPAEEAPEGEAAN